jgi:hypothetical protein
VAAVVLLAGCSTDEPFTEAPPEDTGAVCAFDSDCQYGCADGAEGSHAYCTRPCETEACPQGYVCVARPGLGRVCGLGPCDGTTGCPASYQCTSDEEFENVCRHVDIACTTDTDCPALTACNQGVCAVFCSGDEDCKQGYRCRWGYGCVQCHVPAHCSDGFACIGGLCNTACAETSDCRGGFECIAAACAPIQGGGPGVVGDPCAEHSECEDFCWSYSQCSRVCAGPDDCPAASHCDTNNLVCMPD